tara:strand:+ start:858 stop:980 length:123 start_codon:yes stop_codon:yes gene_type:complete
MSKTINNYVETKWMLQPPRLCKGGCCIKRVAPAGDYNESK